MNAWLSPCSRPSAHGAGLSAVMSGVHGVAWQFWRSGHRCELLGLRPRCFGAAGRGQWWWHGTSWRGVACVGLWLTSDGLSWFLLGLRLGARLNLPPTAGGRRPGRRLPPSTLRVCARGRGLWRPPRWPPAPQHRHPPTPRGTGGGHAAATPPEYGAGNPLGRTPSRPPHRCAAHGRAGVAAAARCRRRARAVAQQLGGGAGVRWAPVPSATLTEGTRRLPLAPRPWARVATDPLKKFVTRWSVSSSCENGLVVSPVQGVFSNALSVVLIQPTFALLAVHEHEHPTISSAACRN